MRREHARRFTAGVFTLALVACQTAGTSLAPPIVHLADLRVKDVRLFEQRYTLALRIENPNPQELPIWGMAYRMSLNDVELGGRGKPRGGNGPALRRNDGSSRSRQQRVLAHRARARSSRPRVRKSRLRAQRELQRYQPFAAVALQFARTAGTRKAFIDFIYI